MHDATLSNEISLKQHTHTRTRTETSTRTRHVKKTKKSVLLFHLLFLPLFFFVLLLTAVRIDKEKNVADPAIDF